MLSGVPLPEVPETDSMPEQRRSNRLPVMRTVKLRTSDGWAFQALCTDLNQSGIGVDSERVLKVGQRVNLEIATPEGPFEPVKLLVIYRMGNHYGLSVLGGAAERLLELLPEQA